jgi:ankyrin repeat protein
MTSIDLFEKLHYVATNIKLPYMVIEYIRYIYVDLDYNQLLREVCNEGRVDILRVLLEYYSRAIDVNAKDNYGFTALHLACYYGHTECCKLLLEHKDIDVNAKDIDANAKDQSGWTALHWACIRGNSECCKELLNHKDIDVNITNNAGDTALHKACIYGRSECETLLMNHGARFYVRTHRML